jgi:uncharacterized protein involved in exopolysaccharide biosynthesis
MRTEDGLQTVAVGDYVAVIRRRWRVVAAGVVVGLGAAAAYLFVTSAAVTATSVVNIAPIVADPYSASRSSASLVDILTEAQAAQSEAVAALAVDALDSDDDPADLRGRLSASAIDATTIVRISVSAPTAQKARAEADAIARAFLDYRSAQATGRIGALLSEDEDRLENLKAQLQDANQRLAAAPSGSTDLAQAQTDQQVLTAQIAAVIERANSFQGVDTSGGQIITPASVNKLSYAPNRTAAIAGGLLAGAVLGAMGAFIRHARDRRVHGQLDIVAAGVGPQFGRLTDSGTARSAHDSGQLALAREHLLSTGVLRAGHGVLAFVEDQAARPAYDVAADLALAFVTGGITVHVVCVPTSDPYQPALSSRLALDRTEPGGLFASAEPRLTAWWPQSRDTWTGETSLHLGLQREKSLVILVCPASATESDRMAVCRLANGVVVYAVEQVSQRANLEAIATIAATVGTPVLGSIIASHDRRPLATPPFDAVWRADGDTGAVTMLRATKGADTAPPTDDGTDAAALEGVPTGGSPHEPALDDAIPVPVLPDDTLGANIDGVTPDAGGDVRDEDEDREEIDSAAGPRRPLPHR